RRSSSRRWCSSTSASPDWTASRWRAASARPRGPGTPSWSPSPATVRKNSGAAPPRSASTATSSSLSIFRRWRTSWRGGEGRASRRSLGAELALAPPLRESALDVPGGLGETLAVLDQGQPHPTLVLGVWSAVDYYVQLLRDGRWQERLG